MVKVKISIYIDKDVWERFKKYASSKGTSASRLLEEILSEALNDDIILSEFEPTEDNEINFQPIKSIKLVSDLVKEMRYEREKSLLP
ncbi:hypothetical protein SJAV_01310 [Sulfurisphaera javensis]|uniref:CopG family transcriptional regulator n=1 Tax=Sulfurisphaera javensis TaxID=2049879 RepID=A0AAT9GMY7_9CREN